MRAEDVQQISFYSNGETIAGHWYPATGGGPAPCVILCAGFCQTKEMLMPDVATVLATAGYHTLAFDYRFIGASGGEPRTRIIPLEQVRDIRAALTWAESRPEVDADRLALWGCSFGGANAVVTAAEDERVKCVVAHVAVTCGRRWLRSLRTPEDWHSLLDRVEANRRERVLSGKSEFVRPNEILPGDSQTGAFIRDTWGHLPNLVSWVTLESVESILEFDPQGVIDRISPRPLLMIAVDRDQIVPNEETRGGIETAQEPKKLVWLPRRFGHWGVETGEGLGLVLDETLDWLGKWMPTG